MKIGSLFTGYGGLDMPLDGEVAWYSEIDKHASAILAKHYPGVPNLGDVTQIDWQEVEPVNVITGGYPCQPFSVAGVRKGKEDERHLWPYVLDCIRTLRPDYAIMENVAGHLTLGFTDVLTDLAENGFAAEWTTLRASDVGAPHRRERLFFIAYSNSKSLQRHSSDTEKTPAGSDGLIKHSFRPATDTQHAERSRVRQTEKLGKRHDMRAHFGKYWLAVSRWEQKLGRPAPEPLTVRDDGRKQLNGEFVEWMMGLPQGWVTSHDLPRRAVFQLLGNGVVPQQAAHAIQQLEGRIR